MLAIQAEKLSKAYQLGEIGTGTLSRDIERWFAKARGKEDPFLKIGESNDRAIKDKSQIVWSLKDINFKVEAGDAIGIIGNNGAGKSTLLKVLSRVTAPTSGGVKIKGRIASLLEVGTGFHPELTGRENIFLNGAMLGMRQKEIVRKFDEIVDFAGVERYIDTPVKRYSSGMYVRLAFAVAAHLDSEILIVDEVLAVGDAEFQKKCLGKMGEVSNGEGRTVLFVSHNMDAIKNLCKNVLLLHNGRIKFIGNSYEGVNQYSKNTSLEYQRSYESSEGKGTDKIVYIKSVKLLNSSKIFEMANDETLSFIFEIFASKSIFNGRLGLSVKTYDKKPIGLAFTESCITLKPGNHTIKLELSNHNLAKGAYLFDFSVGLGNEEEGLFDFDMITEVISLEIRKKTCNSNKYITTWNHNNWGNINFNNVKVEILSSRLSNYNISATSYKGRIF